MEIRENALIKGIVNRLLGKDMNTAVSNKALREIILSNVGLLTASSRRSVLGKYYNSDLSHIDGTLTTARPIRIARGTKLYKDAAGTIECEAGVTYLVFATGTAAQLPDESLPSYMRDVIEVHDFYNVQREAVSDKDKLWVAVNDIDWGYTVVQLGRLNGYKLAESTAPVIAPFPEGEWVAPNRRNCKIGRRVVATIDIGIRPNERTKNQLGTIVNVSGMDACIAFDNNILKDYYGDHLWFGSANYKVLAVATDTAELSVPDAFRFGVEIEGGYDNDPSNYVPLGWGVVGDGSIQIRADYKRECVSPVLHGMAGFASLTTVKNKLIGEAGLRTNDSCGFHIHTSYDDYADQEVMATSRHLPKTEYIINLATLMASIEPIIFRLLPQGRRNNSYCKPMDEGFKGLIKGLSPAMFTAIGNRLMSYIFAGYYKTDRTDAFGNKYDSNRYYALNLHSMFYRGSVEFRYFDANVSMYETYVSLVGKICNTANTVSLDNIKSAAAYIDRRLADNAYTKAFDKMMELLDVMPEDKLYTALKSKYDTSEVLASGCVNDYDSDDDDDVDGYDD